MPSTPSPSLRLNLQETGENLNLWGFRLNESLLLVEQAITGIFTKALTGNYTLSIALYETDEARNAALIFTDGGLTAAPTVTLPNVSKIYYVENRGATYGITFTAGGATGVLPAGRKGFVLCNGSAVWVFDPVGASANSAVAAAASAAAALESELAAAASAELADEKRAETQGYALYAFNQADRAEDEADRAEAAADSVDAASIDARFDAVEAGVAAASAKAFYFNLHYGS